MLRLRDGYGRQLLGWLFAAAALVLPAVALHAALPDGSDTSGRTSFAGRLLIASPDMGPPFDHAVILMAQHNREGALGIVINHLLERRPIAKLLAALGDKPTTLDHGV